MADMTFEEVVRLANQLTPAEKQALAQYLLEAAQERELTPEERIALRRSAIIDIPFHYNPSVRREDWYDDDVR
jgi:hypothetical protein